jgi:hypothetical protein
MHCGAGVEGVKACKMQKDVARCAESLGASGEGRCKRCAQGVQKLSVVGGGGGDGFGFI